MSQASCSSPISQSSLTSRISEMTRAKSSSSGGVGGDHPVDRRRHAAVHAGLAGAATGRPASWSMWRTGEAEGRRHLAQGGALADPQRAVLAVAEELVGVAARRAGGRRARPRRRRSPARRRWSGCRRSRRGRCRRGSGSRCRRSAPCSRRRAAPAARRGTSRRGACAAGGGVRRDRVPRQVGLAVAPARAHEGGVRLGDGGVVRLGRELDPGVPGRSRAWSRRSPASLYAARARRPGGARLPIGFGPCRRAATTASTSRSW